MSTIQKTRPLPPELPANLDDWVLYVKQEPSLNDLVHDVHKLLLGDAETNERYRGYLRAVLDTQAVEGSLSADNIMAAQMIRERATVVNSPLQKEKLATISQALGVVLRRYHASRKERRQMVDGEIVSDNHNSGE